MECKFFVGQKLVCLDGKNHTPEQKFDVLKEGEIYTVREIVPVPEGCGFAAPHQGAPAAVRLVEVVRPLWSTGFEPVYACTRFRPATDISALESLLRTTPVKEPA